MKPLLWVAGRGTQNAPKKSLDVRYLACSALLAMMSVQALQAGNTKTPPETWVHLAEVARLGSTIGFELCGGHKIS